MGSMLISADFELGQTIYVKTDMEQRPYIVTAITVRPGHLTYQVTNNDVQCHFYDFEMTVEKNIRAL